MADKTTKTFTPISTEISKYGVVSLATRPNQPSSYGVGDLSATDLKKRFDFLANQIISEYNKLIELFNSDEILGYLKAHSGSLKSALEQITNKSGDLITKNPEDPKADNEILNNRILAFYNAIVELQAFTEVKKDIHKDKTLSGVYETIANVDLFKEANAEEHKAFTELITALQEFLGLNEHEGDSPLDGVIKDHISDHNDPESLAHSDIRESVTKAQENANKYAENVVSDHNVSVESHSDIRQNVINAETNAKGYADGILRSHNDNAEAHTSIRESVTAVSGDLSSHKTANDSHNDIRLLVKELSDRINALHDTDDTTLDQTKEIVAYIKANRALIEIITTSKVNVDDIIANLTTNVNNKPLAASQGVVLKGLIDTLTNEALNYAKKSDLNNYVQKSGNKVLSDNNYTTDEKNKLAGIDLGKYYNKTEVDGLLENFKPSDGNDQIEVGALEDFEYTDENGSTKRAKRLIDGNIAFDEDYNDFVTKHNIYVNGTTEPKNLLIDKWYIDNKLPNTFATLEAVKEGYVAKEDGKGLSTNDFTTELKNKLTSLPTGGASIDEKNVEIGDQVTAKGDYSAAFGKGFVATENDVLIIGNIGDYLQKNPITITKVGELLEDTDSSGAIVISTTNTITVENSTFGSLIDQYFQGQRNFLLELDNNTRLPIIYTKKIKGGILGLQTIGVQIAVHDSYSCNDANNKTVTNAYVGFAGGENSAVFNQYNISLGESAFSSGSGNASIADYSHSQNLDNKVTGAAGSAAGSLTEAGVTAFSTGHKTKALGESSLTFGIRSETKYTESTESIEKEGGKGSIAGGYGTKANYRYSQAFGFATHTDAMHQFVCGVRNASDADALFIVGNAEYNSGGEKNGFVVKKNGNGYFSGNVYAKNVKLATVNDIPDVPSYEGTVLTSENWETYIDIPDVPGTTDFPLEKGIGTGATQVVNDSDPGAKNFAKANYSFAGGETSSTAEGAKACFAFGTRAEARANASTAFGYRTVANSDSMTVVGRCNDYTKSGAALFVVGNGTSDTNRANAFYVHSNGNTYINGDLYYKNRKAYTELTEIQGHITIILSDYYFSASFSCVLNERVDSILSWSKLREYIDARGWLNLSGYGVLKGTNLPVMPLRMRKIPSGWVIEGIHMMDYSDSVLPELQKSFSDSDVKSCSVHCYPL